jgi:hypothetical protein
MMHQIKFSTEAPGLASRQLLSGHRSDKETETQMQIMSVARNQPHRKGIDDADQSRAGAKSLRMLEPLGRFCRTKGLGDACLEAGRQYGEVCRQGKAAKGFATYHAGDPERSGAVLTDAQIAAMNEVAVRRWTAAEGVLREIIMRLPRAMELLCFDELEPSPYDHGILAQGLYRLAKHFGTLKEGINEGKGY